MSVISIDSASIVIKDQASPKITHPHSTKRQSQYTLKLKKKNAKNRCEIANKCLHHSRSLSKA